MLLLSVLYMLLVSIHHRLFYSSYCFRFFFFRGGDDNNCFPTSFWSRQRVTPIDASTSEKHREKGLPGTKRRCLRLLLCDDDADDDDAGTMLTICCTTRDRCSSSTDVNKNFFFFVFDSSPPFIVVDTSTSTSWTTWFDLLDFLCSFGTLNVTPCSAEAFIYQNKILDDFLSCDDVKHMY